MIKQEAGYSCFFCLKVSNKETKMAFTLEANARTSHGSAESRRLRREGSVPATVYGPKAEPISITVSQRDLLVLLDHKARVVELSIDGNKTTTIIKDVQYHPVKDLPMHVDFLNAENGVEFKTKVPVNLINASQAHGVKMGGQLRRNLHALTIKATLETLPEKIDVDIKNLEATKSFLIRHLPEQPFTILNPSSDAICKITKSRAK